MQIEARVSAGRSSATRLVIALTIVVAICGASLRLAGLDRIGLKGSDNTSYTNIARHWSEGDRVLAIGDTHTMYRPVAYVVYATAIRLFGYNDVSIKAVNASLDTINILLVFLLAFILSRRDAWAAASAAAIYSLLPFTILISRSELTHTLSTSMLLVASILLSLSWFTEGRAARLVFALLSGIATGLGALTHEELIFTATAPALFLLLATRNRNSGVRSNLIEATKWAGSYLLGVFLVALGMLQTHQTDAQVRATEVIGRRIVQDQYLRFVERPLKFGWNALTGSSSTILACLVIVLVLVLITRFLIRSKKGWSGWRLPRIPIEDLPILTVATHLLVYAFFFTYYAVRLFLPLIPLVIIWLVVRSAPLVARYFGGHASRGFLVVLTITVVLADLGNIHTFRSSMASHFETWTPFSLTRDLKLGAGWSTLRTELTKMTWNRRRFEELGSVVNEDSRLLVGASTYHPFPGRRSLQIGYYFGDNAVHLFDHDEPLDELIEEKKIEFVLFTAFQAVYRPAGGWGEWQRYLYEGRWGPRGKVNLGKSLGIADGEYTVQREYEQLRTHMARRGARIILGNREAMMKGLRWHDPVSYIVWTLDPKNWPPLEHEIEATSRSLELASAGRVKKALAVLDAADTSEIPDMGRFRLRLTAARILAGDEHPGAARRRLVDAMTFLPRDTILATALREAYPTPSATLEMTRLFANLQAVKPRNRSLRDLLLALALNLAEFAVEEDDRVGSVEAFRMIEHQLQRTGSSRFTLAATDWCASTCQTLAARDGHSTEVEACLTAASAADR